jgi:hypothetical protein
VWLDRVDILQKVVLYGACTILPFYISKLLNSKVYLARLIS